MKPLYKYSVLLILGLGIIAVLGVTLSDPVIYSLEKDVFPSFFHENTNALKVRAFNSTTDILPLMQDLLDYDGPIMLNINLRDMDQIRYYLDQYSKSNIRLKNLVINLDMSDSEMDEFSSSKQLQQKLLAELMNSTIAMDELDSLMIIHRDDSGMIMSLELQREAILKRMQEISEQYRLESEKTQKIADAAGLDTRPAKEAVQEVKRFVDSVDKKTPVITNPLPRIPTLSLLVNPETGKYGDSIRFSGVYISSTPEKIQYPLTFHIDSGAVVSATTDPDGIYSSLYEIGAITPGEHSVYATSGITSSAIRTFSVVPVNSTTSLDIRALYNKPEILCSGTVLANRPVRNAPVDIIADYHTLLRQTTNKNGAYQAQIRLSPGTHYIQVRFVNDTYPIYLSRSPVYEVKAAPDSILSIRLLDSNMSADELSLTVEPASAGYKDVINITGFLSGKDPKRKSIDLFIDGVYSLGLQTGPDGSYAGTYAVEKIRAGNHTLFAHYREPEAGEIYSESRRIVVNATESVTLLDIGMADDGIGVICMGNVSARGMGVSTAPVELVWDSRNIIRIPADGTGSFRQKISLPVGNHSIFAQFTSQDYPLLPSRSVTTQVIVPHSLDLFVSPPVAYYRDTLTIGGSLQGMNRSYQDIRVFIDGKRTTTVRSDVQGLFSTSSPIENISAGEHFVQAFSGEYSSDPQKFLIIPVASDLVMSAVLIPDFRVLCSGNLTENGRGVRNAPIQIIGDDRPVSETRTDPYGRFEDTITLPLGKHRIWAVFNDISQFPLNASRSQIFEIDIPGIPGNLTLTVMPDTGTFGERLTINGTLSSRINSGETVHLIIDGRKTADTKTGTRGDYSFLYLIDRLSAGSHTVEAVCNNFRSVPRSIFISPVDSETTLSLRQIPGTPRIACSGTVTADNRPLRLAPVALVIDDKNIIRTETDESGKYSEIIPTSAGMHRIQAQFNSTDIFPVYSSNSTVVGITILPELSLDVKPSSGIYNDTLLLEGTLIRPGSPESTVDLFIDNNLLAAAKTDRTGRYSYAMTIEQMPAGKHSVQAQSAGLQSDIKVFRVLPVHSQTTLTITPVNNSALYDCTGTVMAFDTTGEMIRKPLTIEDAKAILAAFWKDPWSRANRPVRFAPVAIISNNDTLLQTTTDAGGHFSERVAFPEGDNRVTAQFINDSYPIFSSSSGKLEVNIPSANISVPEGPSAPPLRILEPLAVVVILLLFIGGAGFYLNRKLGFFSPDRAVPGSIIPPAIPSREGIAGSGPLTEIQQAPDTPPSELLAKDPIFIRYLRLLETDGLSSAARAVYVHFTGTITRTMHIRNHQALTPREFLRSCEEKPFVAAFSSFISLYERVRYGGIKNAETTGEFEESIKKTDQSLEGEDH